MIAAHPNIRAGIPRVPCDEKYGGVFVLCREVYKDGNKRTKKKKKKKKKRKKKKKGRRRRKKKKE